MILFNKITAQDRSHFANNLAVMLKSGVTIDEALMALGEQTYSPRFKKAIESVSNEVRNGSVLSSAFSKEESAFSTIFVSLIRAGEESGTLQENLTFLAEWFERSSDLKREVDGATLYPKLVLGAATLLGGGLSVFILPRLVPLFGQLDVELPLITEILLALSLFLQTKWFWCLLGIAVIVSVSRLLIRIYAVRRFLHVIAIRIPFIGPILVQYQLALITQLFSTLLHSGLPISRSVAIVEEATSNICFRESIKTMGLKVEVGTPLSKAMKEYTNLYPSLCISIVAVGEKSGTLADSFAYLALYYTKEVKAKAKRLPTIIEPVLLIFIAGVVGLVALAIVLPIYKLTGSITR